MVPRKLKTRQIDRAKYRIYLNKASDFYETMIDALLSFQSGVRSVSQDHREVAQLLRQHVDSKGVLENSKRLLKVIGMKNLVEYEARNFTQKEASAAFKENV